MTKPKKKARTDMRIYLQIFHLKFERHLTYRQIALALDIGRSTVNDIVTRFNNLNMQWPLPDGVRQGPNAGPKLPNTKLTVCCPIG